MHRERLEELIRVLEKVDDRRFTMFDWWQHTGCGTAGCALGHAAHHRPFRDAGLRVNEVGTPTYTDPANPLKYPELGFDAGAAFFAITHNQAMDLFYAVRYYANDDVPIGTSITTKNVIDRIRKLLEEPS